MSGETNMMNRRRLSVDAPPSDDDERADPGTPEWSHPETKKTTAPLPTQHCLSRIGKLVGFAGLWAGILLTLPCVWILTLCILPLVPLFRKLGFRNEAMLLDLVECCWTRILLFLAGIRVEVEGKDHLLQFSSAGKSVLFMSNHASGLDPFVLRGYLPMSPRFILKRSLMLQLPPVFVLVYLHGHIPINRGNRNSAIRSLNKAAEKLQDGRSILIFPEGTRSKTGKLLEFKRGPFYLAHDSRAPIVPVYVEGTFELWNAASWSVHPDPGTIRIRILQPMTTKEEESVDQLEAKVRAVLLNAENEKKPVPQ